MTTTAKTATVPGPRAAADYDGHLLEVRDLHVEFHTRDGVAKAVNGVNYTVDMARPSPSSASPAPASP